MHLGLFAAWEAIFSHGGNVADLSDPRRRLRWALDELPGRRDALPLISRLADEDGEGLFHGLEDADLRQLEDDLRGELAALRARIAQSLPVIKRWLVVQGGESVNPAGAIRLPIFGQSSEPTRCARSLSTSAGRQWHPMTGTFRLRWWPRSVRMAEA